MDGILKRQLLLHKLVSELISILSSQLNPGEFLSRFLTSAVRLIEGEGGTVWVKRAEKLEPLFHTGKSAELVPVDEEQEGGEEGILVKMSSDTRPFVFPVRSPDGNSDGLIGIYVPIEADDGLFAILKVVKKRASNVVYQEEIELLTNMGGLVRLYLNQLHLPKVIGKMGEIQKLFQVNQEIFASIETDEIAYAVANLVPTVVGCDRCIVGIAEKDKIKIKAITGQDFIEKKSATVRNLRGIFELVGKQGEAVTITPDIAEEPGREGLHDLVSAYFEVQPFRIMQAIPVKHEDCLLGVVSIETSKESVFPPNDLAMFNFVANQTAVALKNARLYRQIPFARTWQRLGALRDKVTGWSRFRTIATTATLLVVAAVFFLKVSNKIGGDCEVLPLATYYGRPRVDGVIKEFLVNEGDRVEPGAVVALLDDTEINNRLREAEARREVTRANMAKYFGLGQMADYAIEELKMKGIDKEIELLESELKDTQVVVAGSGVVLTPNLRFTERIGKPVAKGEELVEVGRLDRLLLAVAVPEKDIKFVRHGQKIRFLLNAFPEKQFEVAAGSIRQKAEPRPEGNFFIVESEVDLPVTSFKPGMKGKAKVYADKEAVWRVVFGDMIDWFRMKVFF